MRIIFLISLLYQRTGVYDIIKIFLMMNRFRHGQNLEESQEFGKEVSRMEGVERYQVKLLPHNPAWEREFISVREELQAVWGDNILDIQHVGSTAILSICAKPILDVAVRLKSIHAMDVKRLQACRYDYCGAQHGKDGYHLFVLRGENQVSLRHIHCYDRKEKEFEQLVGFRDYLNGNEAAAMQYEALKIQLAAKYPYDREAYTRGKEQFIQTVYGML